MDRSYAPSLTVPLSPQLVNGLARMTQAIGTAGFFDAVLDAVGSVCRLDSGGAMVFYRQHRPRQIVHRFNPRERSLPQDAYVCGPYALDPHYQLFLQGQPSGVYWLRDIAPDDFFESEYYRVFYSQIGLSDSIELVWRINEDTALHFFMERGSKSPPFQQADLIAIHMLAPLVFAGAARHHELTATASTRETDTQTHAKVQTTIENFASSLLTRREREVLFLLISGYSAALSAQRLKTTEGTVKIHRRNIYKKLDIGSQAELFSLFINCIAFASPGQGIDPLQVYQSAPVSSRKLSLLGVG